MNAIIYAVEYRIVEHSRSSRVVCFAYRRLIPRAKCRLSRSSLPRANQAVLADVDLASISSRCQAR
jgi:hypothetical protein